MTAGKAVCIAFVVRVVVSEVTSSNMEPIPTDKQ